ncbi:UNVERIFIED_ORG: hypothetical protein QFZ59_000774 [Bacillus sp. B2I3]|nr:hypothetical protein [Bacillus sp. B2I3]
MWLYFFIHPDFPIKNDIVKKGMENPDLKNTVDIQNKLIISLAQRLEQHTTYLEDSTKNRDNKLLEHLNAFQKENEKLHKEIKLMK